MLSTDRAFADGSRLEAQLLQELALGEPRLTGELDAQQRRLVLQQTGFAEQRRQFGTELAAAADELQRRRAQWRLADAQLQKILPLAERGHLPRVVADNARSDLLEGDQALADVRQREQRLHTQLAELALQEQRAPLELASQGAVVQNQLSELRARLTELRSRQQHALLASREGVVSEVYVSAGEQVDADRQLLSLVDEHDALEGVLFVPSRAIGFVRAGQTVRVRYDAFPHQRFGASRHACRTWMRRCYCRLSCANPFR